MPTNVLSRVSFIALGLCVLALGLMAGFFGTYSANVNLAMREMDGQTYALVQSAFNRNVRHALFFSAFFGPLPLGLLALGSGWPQRRRPWWRLMTGVTVAYALGIVLFTREVNLPLNHLTESWTAATMPADWARTRDAWNLANTWRATLSLVLFTLGLVALVWRAGHPPTSGEPATMRG